MNKVWSILLATLWIALLVLSFSGRSFCTSEPSSGIIRVPGDYPTIQEAIDAAAPGSLVLVSSGTYYEHLLVNKTLSLVGNDRTNTIIDGNNTGLAVTVTADNVLVSGFTLRNSNRAPNVPYGSIYLDHSNGSIISDNIIAQNVCNGIMLRYSNDTTIRGNLITLNGGSGGDPYGVGIYLLHSNGNSVTGNVIANNVVSGLAFDSSDGSLLERNVIEDSTSSIVTLTNSLCTIHHNMFIDHGGVPLTSNVTWDDGSQGNYWSDYSGLDDGSNGRIAGDGVGDTALPHMGVDYYPLICPPFPIPVLRENREYPVGLASNSTVSAFQFDQTSKKIAFSVTGPSNTTGYFNVTIPTALLRDNPWKILLNSTDVTSQATISTNQTHTFIYLAYNQSNHSVQIIGTWVVPEFPSYSLLTLTLLTVTFATIILKKKKNSRMQ